MRTRGRKADVAILADLASSAVEGSLLQLSAAEPGPRSSCDDAMAEVLCREEAEDVCGIDGDQRRGREDAEDALGAGMHGAGLPKYSREQGAV